MTWKRRTFAVLQDLGIGRIHSSCKGCKCTRNKQGRDNQQHRRKLKHKGNAANSKFEAPTRNMELKISDCRDHPSVAQRQAQPSAHGICGKFKFFFLELVSSSGEGEFIETRMYTVFSKIKSGRIVGEGTKMGSC